MTKKKNNLETSADEAPIKAENPSSKKPRSEIDEIFDGKKRKKSEQEKTQKPIKGDAAVKPKGMKKTKEKKKKKKTEKGNLGNDESFGVSDSRPRKKTEGFSIYTEEELGLNNPDAGGTPLCPFDCSCCF
ncbi:hypothetical protein PanWU01x14_033660 [Parasponia andersonii]|uniref:DUF1764 domain-containing protein n=1 Tax=Parasponia andersonii TaxID=3476 RepID=A0A2P5DTS1_PARAD|nr:hypothetical protein PanWU01x14_033660 [Parasponia andersonii]